MEILKVKDWIDINNDKGVQFVPLFVDANNGIIVLVRRIIDDKVFAKGDTIRSEPFIFKGKREVISACISGFYDDHIFVKVIGCVEGMEKETIQEIEVPINSVGEALDMVISEVKVELLWQETVEANKKAT